MTAVTRDASSRRATPAECRTTADWCRATAMKKVKKKSSDLRTFAEDVHPKGIDASEHDGALRFWFRDHPGKLWTVLDILSCLVFRARRCMRTVQNLLVIAPM